MTSERIFYKVYQDKESMDTYYIADDDDLSKSMECWKEYYIDNDSELFPVIEPVMMTQEEFDNLPDFQGY